MSNKIIKVGFCVAYDWELLKISVPLVYARADMICFSIDKNRKTWNGTPYDFDESKFTTWVQDIDVDKKIIIAEGNFSDATLSPIQNDNLQRNEMAKIMGTGGWHIQIDADEYILKFNALCEYLIKIDPNPMPGVRKNVNVCLNLIPLIKKVESGYVAAGAEYDQYETAPFATNNPVYQSARRNGHFNILTPFFALHETWARDEDILLEKLGSWGHRNDFNTESYYSIWQSIDSYNYKYIKNFHPLNPTIWPFLILIPARSREGLLNTIKKTDDLKIGRLRLFWKNNRFIQSLTHRIKRYSK